MTVPSPAATIAPRVRYVHSFAELVETPFSGVVNALCWRRTLPGDFAELVAHLGPAGDEPVRELDPAWLQALPLSASGDLARAAMLADHRRLDECGLAPALNCVHDYPRDARDAPIATDVFSFHVDRAPCETATWLCTYHGPASEGLVNEEAQRLVDLPALRARLLAIHGGQDDAAFAEFLSERSYDLHYAALAHARPYSFGIGNLWRLATLYPGCPVAPSIHRAPTPGPGDPPRLLLIS